MEPACECLEAQNPDTVPLVGGEGSQASATRLTHRRVLTATKAVGILLLAGTALAALGSRQAWTTNLRSSKQPKATATVLLNEVGGQEDTRELVLVDANVQDFYVGQRVRVRDAASDPWKDGEVTRLLPLSVRPKGWEDSFSWNMVQAGPAHDSAKAPEADEALEEILKRQKSHAELEANPIAQGLDRFINTEAPATTPAPTTTTEKPTTTPTPTTKKPTTTTNAWSCKAYGCTPYNPAQHCQCNIDCLAHGNCCPDYGDKCQEENFHKTTSTTSLPATTTVPTTSVKTTTVTTLPQIITDQSQWVHPTLFCFALVRVSGYEPELVKEQYLQGVGIFACDEFAPMSNGLLTLGPDRTGRSVTAILVKAPHVTMGKYGVDGQTTNSWLNTLNFMHAWDALKADGRVWKHDWTVKADPDAVLIPDRLRTILKPNMTDGSGANYILNCEIPVGNPLLYGALEVFSKMAVGMYLDNQERCLGLDWNGWGEDYYMQMCLNMLGANRTVHTNMVSDSNCHEVACTDHSRAAYHPFKSTQKWFDCWGQATQLVR